MLRCYFMLAVCCVLAVVDNGVMGQGVYRNNYRTVPLMPYRGGKSFQPISNSLGGGRNYYNAYNPYKSYDPYSGSKMAPAKRPVQQYKWKLDLDDSVEDISNESIESVEVHRYLPYRRF